MEQDGTPLENLKYDQWIQHKKLIRDEIFPIFHESTPIPLNIESQYTIYIWLVPAVSVPRLSNTSGLSFSKIGVIWRGASSPLNHTGLFLCTLCTRKDVRVAWMPAFPAVWGEIKETWGDRRHPSQPHRRLFPAPDSVPAYWGLSNNVIWGRPHMLCVPVGSEDVLLYLCQKAFCYCVYVH